MKNKSFSRGLYVFGKKIRFKEPRTILLELVIPHSKLEKSRDLLENIQRWEDDGGGIVDEISSMAERLPVRPTDHDQSMLQRLPGEGEIQ